MLALVFLTCGGCAALQAGQAVQAGRSALQRQEPRVAVANFRRAAELDPQYENPIARSQNVWIYLGRAYYEAGDYAEARNALQKSLAMTPENPIARLYLALANFRGGSRESGARDIESGLRETYDWLNQIASTPSNGIYWDPARAIRNRIQTAVSEPPAVRLDDNEFASIAEWVGRRVDEEPDRARRDEVRDKYETGRSD
jgi:tetratricopeptide (TPR) repeat protein